MHVISFAVELFQARPRSQSRRLGKSLQVSTIEDFSAPLGHKPRIGLVDPTGGLYGFIWCVVAGLFRSRAPLEAEILVLRHQLNVLRRRSPKRVAVSNADRLVFVALSLGSQSAGRPKDPPAGDDNPLAPRRIGARTAWRPAKDLFGYSPAHSRDEHCQPPVGSITDSRRTSQAWDRCRPDQGCKIHGEEKTVCAHLSLKKDAPIPRDAERVGGVLTLPILGWLHHRYDRV